MKNLLVIMFMVVVALGFMRVFEIADRLIDSYNVAHITQMEADRFAEDLQTNPDLIGD